MCRNIRILHNFRPPTTEDEIRAAALQYVRKVSGATSPPRTAEEAFASAINEVAATTARLLAALPARGEPRTREEMRERAKARWKLREARITKPA